MVLRGTARCLKEGGALLRQIWTLCRNEIVKCFVSNAIIKWNTDVKQSRNIYAKELVNLLVDLVKMRLLFQGSTSFLQNVHLSTRRSGLAAGENNLSLNDDVKEVKIPMIACN